MKLNDVVSNVYVAPFPFFKVKLKIYVDKTNSKITNMNVCDNLDANKIAIPKKLQMNWKLFVKKYHVCDFDRFI